MIYGCIGEHLPHSFSKIIHEKIEDYDYILKELTPNEVAPFLCEKEFLGINVTIPYKETVIPYLDETVPPKPSAPSIPSSTETASCTAITPITQDLRR